MSGAMNPSGERPCCELLSNLERESIVLGREYIKYRIQEDEYLAKKEKLKEVAAFVYQKLNNLWFSAYHMGESDERRRAITDFVSLTSKAWENDYKNIERDTINDRLTKGDGPLTGLLEKIQCSVTFTEARFRTAMLWDSACHNKFNALYNEMMPKLARFSCNYIVQCTGTIIDKTVMVLQTIDENIRRFTTESLSNYQPSHFSADHSDQVEPLPLVALSHIVKLLTAELLPPPQATALDLRARDAEVLQDVAPARRSYPPATRELALFRAPYLPPPQSVSSSSPPPPPPPAEPKRLPFVPQPLIKAANLPLQWPPNAPLTNPNYDFPRSETYPPNSSFLPLTRNQPYPFHNLTFNPFIGTSPFPPSPISPSFGFNNSFYGGLRNYPPFPGYPMPYDMPAWEMELRARQAEFLGGPTLFFNRPPPAPEAKIDVGTEENNTPAKGGKKQVPIIKRRRRRKMKDDDGPQEGESLPKFAETKERKPRKTQLKQEAADLEAIRMPELLSNVLSPLA